MTIDELKEYLDIKDVNYRMANDELMWIDMSCISDTMQLKDFLDKCGKRPIKIMQLKPVSNEDQFTMALEIDFSEHSFSQKFEVLYDNYIDYKGHTLYRIRALKDFEDVKKGDIGGYVETIDNLSQYDRCWIYGDAKVYGNALVYNDAIISEHCIVCDNTRVYGNASITDNAYIGNNAHIYDYAFVCGNAIVVGKAEVYGNTSIHDNVRVYGNSIIGGIIKLCGDSVFGD